MDAYQLSKCEPGELPKLSGPREAGGHLRDFLPLEDLCATFES